MTASGFSFGQDAKLPEGVKAVWDMAKAPNANVVFCQLVPWQFDYSKFHHTKISFRRTSFSLTRILANMGSESTTPLLGRFSSPIKDGATKSRWLQGMYLDVPITFDDPYRFFIW